MSIEEGRFIIGGVAIDKDTGIETFAEKDGYIFLHARHGRLVSVSTEGAAVTFLGMDCSAELEYFDKRLMYIRLVPAVPEEDLFPYPTQKAQAARYALVKTVLTERYGAPDREDKTSLSYSFPGGELISKMKMNGHDRYTGGDILIMFGAPWASYK